MILGIFTLVGGFILESEGLLNWRELWFSRRNISAYISTLSIHTDTRPLINMHVWTHTYTHAHPHPFLARKSETMHNLFLIMPQVESRHQVKWWVLWIAILRIPQLSQLPLLAHPTLMRAEMKGARLRSECSVCVGCVAPVCLCAWELSSLA